MLAFQVKGPVCWLLTVAPLTVYLLTQDRRRWRILPWVGGLMLLSAALLGIWAAAIQSALPYDLKEKYLWETVGRITSDKAPFGSPLYYLGLVYYVAPWSLFLIPALAAPFREAHRERRAALRFLFIWLVTGLVLLSLPREKQLRYAVPLMAAAALLLGYVLDHQMQRAGRRRRRG